MEIGWRRTNFTYIHTIRHEKRNKGCNRLRCIHNLDSYCNCNIFAQIFVCSQGKWHKDFFTNGDVVDLLHAIKLTKHIGDMCGHFYSIVNSTCSTMSKYKLFKKAEKIVLQTKGRRKSSRRLSTSHVTTAPATAPTPGHI